MKYHDFRQALNTQPIFSPLDLLKRKLLVFPYQLSEWTNKGYLLRLKNGLYLFKEYETKIKPEVVAFYLYQPSYLSLQYVLNTLNLIPDMTYELTNITPKATRRYQNSLGVFSYHKIKPQYFFGFTKQLDAVTNLPFLIAEGEKALLDYFYLHSSELNTPEQIKSLRLNDFWREDLSEDKLLAYTKRFASPKLTKIVTTFIKET